MNVTLSVDDEVLTRARELASRRGTSLNQIIRDYLQELASDLSPDEILVELNALWSTSTADSGGKRWTREELHERAGVR
jgi:hypothetical protein